MNKYVNVIRGLAIDMIHEANSGHPGIAMGAAPIVYALYKDHMNMTVDHQDWINRDRFVLSAGHGSSMLYALNHLLGFDITIDDLKQFRQVNSKTPGHPEYRDVPGVEVTTGPLGQGIAMGVGMAYASNKFASMINVNGIHAIDNYTYILCGDGDLMEGISYEACSFAGVNNLDKLIILYDSNDISLDGETNLSFQEDIKKRFEAQNFDYQLVDDGEDVAAISNAISKAKASNKPSIIEIKTTIGFGSKLAGTNKVHGAPLSDEDIKAVKEKYNLSQKPFYVEPDVYTEFRNISNKGNQTYEQWLEVINQLPEKQRNIVNRLISGKKVEIICDNLNETLASRQSGQKALRCLAKQDDLLLTGSADLFASNLTNVENDNQNIYFGVREFGMGAIANGIYLFAKTPIYVSTFFVFSDYLKAAMRLASLMKLPINYIYTHDSIFVGEDGPTHQPIEQIATFRSMPNILTFRPADANEVMACYKIAYQQQTTPSVMCLSRQPLAMLPGNDDINQVINNVDKGAYIIFGNKDAKYTIIATGSEVNLAIEVATQLNDEGYDFKVVSMPCVELFLQQDEAYQKAILSKKCQTFVIEFATTFGWDRFVCNHDHIIGIDNFGMSGKANDVVKELHLTKDDIIARIKNEL